MSTITRESPAPFEAPGVTSAEHDQAGSPRFRRRAEAGPSRPQLTMADIIPKDIIETRQKLLAQAKDSPAMRERAQRLAASGPELFITYFCWTYDPRTRAHLPFWLFPKQVELIGQFEAAYQEGVDLLVPKGRDMGVTWAVLAWCLYHWLYDPGFSALLGSRNALVVDDLATTDSLFGRLDYLLRNLPVWMLPYGWRPDKHRKEMHLINPANGNAITGQGSVANFGRGQRASVIVLDEFPEWPDRERVDSSTADSSRTRIFIGTPDLDGYLDWFIRHVNYRVFELKYYDHPLKTGDWLEFERHRREHDPEGFEREVLGVRAKSRIGLVYPAITAVPAGPQFRYNGYWPLSCSIDFGLDDTTAMLWFANRPGTDRYWLVDAYERSGKRIAFFVPLLSGVLREEPDFNYTARDIAVIDRHDAWPAPAFYGDPAGKNRNQVTDTSVISELRDAGIHVRTNTHAIDHQTRLTRTREFLTRLEGIAAPECDDAHVKLSNARWERSRQGANRVTPPNKPVHDETSHYRTALEFMAVNDPRQPLRQRDQEERFSAKAQQMNW